MTDAQNLSLVSQDLHQAKNAYIVIARSVGHNQVFLSTNSTDDGKKTSSVRLSILNSLIVKRRI